MTRQPKEYIFHSDYWFLELQYFRRILYIFILNGEKIMKCVKYWYRVGL